MTKAFMRHPTPYHHNSKMSATNILSKDGIRPLIGLGLMITLNYMIWRIHANLLGSCARGM